MQNNRLQRSRQNNNTSIDEQIVEQRDASYERRETIRQIDEILNNEQQREVYDENCEEQKEFQDEED